MLSLVMSTTVDTSTAEDRAIVVCEAGRRDLGRYYTRRSRELRRSAGAAVASESLLRTASETSLARLGKSSPNAAAVSVSICTRRAFCCSRSAFWRACTDIEGRWLLCVRTDSKRGIEVRGLRVCFTETRAVTSVTPRYFTITLFGAQLTKVLSKGKRGKRPQYESLRCRMCSSSENTEALTRRGCSNQTSSTIVTPPRRLGARAATQQAVSSEPAQKLTRGESRS